MKKWLGVLSAIMFSIVLIGTLVVGIYIIFIKDVSTKPAVVPSEKTAEGENAPLVVVEDVFKDNQQEKDNSMQKYAYKKEKSELSWLDILFYGLLFLLGLFLIKKLKQGWEYMVKNSV